MRLSCAVLTMLLSFSILNACSDGGAAGTADTQPEQDLQTADETQQDTLPDVVVGCNTVADCAGKEIPGGCKEVACVNSTCEIVDSANGTVCDDEQACTENDQCFQGQCKGQTKSCDDQNLCTNDQCNSATGQCEYLPNTATCDDGNKCTKDDACKDGTCAGGENICKPCTEDSECEKYDDGDKCNGVVRCVVGECVADPESAVDCASLPVVACKSAYCDSVDGQCKYKNMDDGTTCSDESACTKDDTCDKGMCKGNPLTCNDGNPCTEDGCNPETGCTKPPVANGTECNDGNLCSEGDSCQNGVCTGTENPACGCTQDSECTQFEDGNLCNGIFTCIEGKCAVAPESVKLCPLTDNPCKTNQCNPATGECELKLALDSLSCDDGNACTQQDYCAQGTCVGLPVDCKDNKACTTDTCDPLVGCVYTPKQGNCGDGDPCTLNDHCVDGLCVGDADPTCGCTADSDCPNDADLCNGTLKCVSAHCVLDPATVVDCSGVAKGTCETATCVAETGACVVSNVPDATECNDNNACTKNDKCLAGVCKGQNIICDDDNVCTSDGCSSAIGCVYSYNNNSCNDNDYCTVQDFCSQGVCTGLTNPDCTCQSDADCASRDDQDLCNGSYKCIGYKCQIDPATVVVCDTSTDTECSSTVCDPTSGDCVASNAADGKPCTDDNACTLVDSCLGGICQGDLDLVCDDDNVCTNDLCDAQLGCIVENTEGTCDDFDDCTDGDYCAEGVCQPGTNYVCGVCQPDWTLGCSERDTWNNGWSGSTDVIEEYACSSWTYTGPEYTYTYTAPYDCTVTVTLSDEEADTDIMVLENTGTGCQPDTCITYDYSAATFEATAGTTYYFVVDGYEAGELPGEGSYTIDVTCVPKSEINCTDGLDDDGDGLIDCEDDQDCLPGSEACPLPQCVPAWTLNCGDSDSWATYQSGSTDILDAYSCSPFAYPGPEYTYTYESTVTGQVTFALADETADLDLMVLEAGADGGCLGTNCLAYGMDEVTVDVVEGATYYIVVDGYNGEEGSYTITANCP